MRFQIHAMDRAGRPRVFSYDNQTSELQSEDGSLVPVLAPQGSSSPSQTPARAFSRDEPVGKGQIKTLKIQLGLSCNYACDYCSQRFVPRADETSRRHIDGFLDRLGDWMPEAPRRIEFWGGEPLVYIKTLKPLAEKLRARYPDAQFGMVTNGSLLTLSTNEWLDGMGFGIGLSHDGPGQHVRGPDPLEDPKSREAILDLYRRLAPQRRMSFNTMLHRENLDRAAIQRFFVELTGDPHVAIGEGGVIDAYDDSGISHGLTTRDEHLWLRRATLAQLRNGSIVNFDVAHRRVREWVASFAYQRPASVLGTKCGMERPDTIAVDLTGSVVTCQNVSSASEAPNGLSHKIGTVDDLGAVSLNTSTHWSRRDSCPTCPMLQACKGNCMFLEGENFWRSCENSFNDHVAFFAYAIEAVTGCLPYRIEGGSLPEARRDIWGADRGEISLRRKKVIPILQKQ